MSKKCLLGDAVETESHECIGEIRISRYKHDT